jgi:hypothetical protein
MRLKYILPTILAFSSLAGFSQTQNSPNSVFKSGSDDPILNTSVPFLTIAPDARSGALADAGVATSADAMSARWNAAKMAFIESDMGFSISYNPWLRKLVNDMSLSYLTGYTKLSEQEVIGLQMTYFDLGKITFTDNNGDITKEHKAKEFSIGGNYSRKLSENLGVGLGLKFIHSNLAGNYASDAGQMKPGNTAAGDIGIFHTKDYNFSGKNVKINLGANISDIGAKISYSNGDNRNFIPTTLRLGTAITGDLDPFNKLTLVAELSKLMVPSTQRNAAGFDSIPDKALIGGMFGSFSDSPSGFSGEIRELIYHFGLEYWYHNAMGDPLFAIRGGYFKEGKTSGNRDYITLGFGFRYQQFGIDFAYLVPTAKNNPLAESLRFSLLMAFTKRNAVESVVN